MRIIVLVEVDADVPSLGLPLRGFMFPVLRLTSFSTSCPPGFMTRKEATLGFVLLITGEGYESLPGNGFAPGVLGSVVTARRELLTVLEIGCRNSWDAGSAAEISAAMLSLLGLVSPPGNCPCPPRMRLSCVLVLCSLNWLSGWLLTWLAAGT